MTDKIVVLLKTHKWSPDIEEFALKIMKETLPYSIDFFILMHTDDGSIYNKVVDENLKKLVIKVTENEVGKIYTNGFYNMWLSNHWILMWFFKKHGRSYRYYWSVEYDVRIVGNSKNIWQYDGTEDFLYVKGNVYLPKAKYSSYYIGNQLKERQKRYGFLQLARYSHNALTYLDKCYDSGENGQDEMITYSLLHRENFIMSNSFLRKMVRGVWTWEEKYVERNRIIYNYYKKMEDKLGDKVFIFHPIK
ncbi:MAG: hypothetical protein QXW79_01435 [Thermoplasmata archaeon]